MARLSSMRMPPSRLAAARGNGRPTPLWDGAAVRAASRMRSRTRCIAACRDARRRRRRIAAVYSSCSRKRGIVN